MVAAIATEAERRRTFAIISHPDAGKTTLTEKLLLFSGVIAEAGAVGARSGRREVTSDWMEMERARGISITSTVLQFEVGGRLFNLLDTPGHRDFSEDTYRVLSAVDSAVIVIDAAKGIEAQTLKLFQVAQARGIPLITFVNKCDRPGLPPLEILDDIERQLGIVPTPITWPVGSGRDFQGVIDRRDGTFWEFERTARGSKIGAEHRLALDEESAAGDEWREAALGELALLDEVEADHDADTFLAGATTPVFFGSALWNFGVRLLLEAVDGMAPAPHSRADVDGVARPLDDGVSGFVFKIQANLDPRHRDRVAYMRLCTGHFERGMSLVSNRTGRTLTTKYAHQVFGRERDTVEEAYPGDIVGLVNATDLLIGDTLSLDGSVRYPPIPTFAPEFFRVARNRDTARYKQFRRGITQLDEEGVIQILRTADGGEREPIVAAVGEMQYEVALHRLTHEFNAEVVFESTPWSVARRTDDDGAAVLAGVRGVEVARRSSGVPVALFPNRHRLEAVERDHPRLLLDPIIAL
ncbi:MAG TPA: peptide chain release factor 3 [Acidimicrobiia bacterium]|nr:peptide chain release factor 3 [Acidimicrobiia bacterium]